MRLSIRWKLMLAIGLPLLAVYLVLLFADYRHLSDEAELRKRIQLTELVKQHAVHLEGELSTVAQVADSTAVLVAQTPNLAKQQIHQMLRANARMHPMIHGARDDRRRRRPPASA